MFERSQPSLGSSDAPSQPSRARTILKYTWIVIGLVALYSGWIVYSRWAARQVDNSKAEQKQLEADRRAVEMLGGNRFEILHFYAAPGVIARGQEAQLCYGASNAKAVRIEPPVGTTWPSHNRCFYISPAKDTTYTLTIEDANGQTKTATLTMLVR